MSCVFGLGSVHQDDPATSVQFAVRVHPVAVRFLCLGVFALAGDFHEMQAAKSFDLDGLGLVLCLTEFHTVFHNLLVNRRLELFCLPELFL